MSYDEGASSKVTEAYILYEVEYHYIYHMYTTGDSVDNSRRGIAHRHTSSRPGTVPYVSITPSQTKKYRFRFF